MTQKVFRPKTGWCIVLPDSDEDRTASGILFPDQRRRRRHSGSVVLHQPSLYWMLLEGVPLDGEHILFEQWAWREFRLDGPELYLVPERAIFAVVENPMKKQQLIEELQAKITEIVHAEVKHNDDLDDDELVNIDAVLGASLAQEIVEDAEAEEELDDTFDDDEFDDEEPIA